MGTAGPHRGRAGSPDGRPHRGADSGRLGRVRHNLRTGFRLTGSDQEQLRGFFASTLAASLFAWDIAFTLGAYHTVFYSRLLQLLVVSTVLLVGALILRPAVRIRPWMAVALGIPLCWLTFRLFAPAGAGRDAYHRVDLVLIGATVAALPLTLWTVGNLVAPELFALPNRRYRLAAVLVVTLVTGVGWTVGRHNDTFLTCQEFLIAGDDTPSNCADPPPPSPVPSPSPG